jgi:hypothetical protein
MRNNFFLILDDGRMSVTGTGFCREKIWHPSTFWGQTRRKLLIGSGRDFYLEVRSYSNKHFFSKPALIVNAIVADSVFCITVEQVNFGVLLFGSVVRWQSVFATLIRLLFKNL